MRTTYTTDAARADDRATMASREYLQRYLSGGDDKKKKKKEKKAKKARKGGPVKKTCGMKLVDDDDDWGGGGAAQAEESDEDERPQIVYGDDVSPEDVAPKRAGTWSTVPANGRDASPPRRGRAGSDSDASPPRRGRAGSDSDASPPRRGRAGSDSDASPPRRGRAGSDSDASPPRRGRADSDGDASPPRRGRAGSDSDASPPRRGRAGSDSDASPPRRGRAGSDGDTSPPRRGRADSDGDASPPRRKKARAGGDGDASPPRRVDFSAAPAARAAAAAPDGRAKMGSGHAAGVLTGEEFRVAEEKLRERRAAERAAMDPEASGKGAATVYRDKRGRKLDMLNEFMRIEDERAGAAREAKEQFEWGRGTKQKADEARARDELAAVAAEPFARTAADPALEASRRGAIRDGDPMADYFAARRDEAEEAARPPDAKPRYKGPTPPPNRFGIRPGYRWDGIDRGNGWENKLYKAQSEAVGRKNDRYAWSCADM